MVRQILSQLNETAKCMIYKNMYVCIEMLWKHPHLPHCLTGMRAGDLVPMARVWERGALAERAVPFSLPCLLEKIRGKS